MEIWNKQGYGIYHWPFLFNHIKNKLVMKEYTFMLEESVLYKSKLKFIICEVGSMKEDYIYLSKQKMIYSQFSSN